MFFPSRRSLLLGAALCGLFSCADEAPQGPRQGGGADNNGVDPNNGDNNGAIIGDNNGAIISDNNGAADNNGVGDNNGGGDNNGDPGCGVEVCDGADNDCDGEADEGLACLCGDDGACYGGLPGTRNKGICQDGARTCDSLGEFWGPCEGWTGPQEEACEDGLDNNCDGQIDEGCGPECLPEEACGDGLDNDCDGQVDEGCALCDAEETCGDGVDNDCDGLIDDGCAVCGELEICGDGADNDCDGATDEDCEDQCGPGLQRACYPGNPQQVNVGICAAGQQRCVDATLTWGPCEGATLPAAQEACDDGLDNNCNGQVDEGCQVCDPQEACFDGIDNNCDGQIDEGCGGECAPDQREGCFPGPGQAGQGQCREGERACDARGFWGPCEGFVTAQAERCGNGVDEDCNGQDLLCEPITINLNINGDCVTTRCPDNAPYPVGCNVIFQGGDERGCVANRPNDPVIYFQEGDQCGAGRVTGTLLCSDQPGGGINAQNCPINKPRTFYPTARNGCPDTN